MIIEKEHCDYYLEVYHWDYTIVDKVVTKKEKNELPIEKSHKLTTQIINSIQGQLAGMKLLDLKLFLLSDEEFRAARKNNLQYQAMTDHVASLRKLIEKRQGQDLYLAPKEEKEEGVNL